MMNVEFTSKSASNTATISSSTFIRSNHGFVMYCFEMFVYQLVYNFKGLKCKDFLKHKMHNFLMFCDGKTLTSLVVLCS